MLILSYIIVGVLCFTAGRHSYIVFRDEYLENKKKELESYHKELLELQQHLRDTDTDIRNKWQNMVVDAANYQFSMVDTRGKWTDLDDRFLSSWNSAEQ